MSQVLEKLPRPRKFIYCMKLRTGSYVAAAAGIIHPTIYVGIYFSEANKMHDWCKNVAGFMAAFLFIFSLVLFIGITINNHFIAVFWVWFSLLFMVTMLVVFVMLSAKNIILGQPWIQFKTAGMLILYMCFFYLIIIVHSYSVELEEPDDGDYD